MRFTYGAIGMILGYIFCKSFHVTPEYMPFIIAMFAAGAMAGGD